VQIAALCLAMTVYNQNNENGRVNEINLQNEYRFLNEAPIRYFIQRFENIGIYYLENPLNIVFYLGFMIGL
jgi:hypothetical protein